MSLFRWFLQSALPGMGVWIAERVEKDSDLIDGKLAAGQLWARIKLGY
ncbi:MAG: hypothetical protein WDM87_18255 [Terracidiphilus sp.]